MQLAASGDGRTTLDEASAKRDLSEAGVPIPAGERVDSVEAALEYASALGFPVVLKALGIAHKTEHNAVRLNLSSAEEIEQAASRAIRTQRSTLPGGDEAIPGRTHCRGYPRPAIRPGIDHRQWRYPGRTIERRKDLVDSGTTRRNRSCSEEASGRHRYSKATAASPPPTSTPPWMLSSRSSNTRFPMQTR